MRVLILSTQTGEGHNSASKAIKEYLEATGCKVDVMDVLKSGKKDVSGRVSHLYSFITTHLPFLIGFLYNAGALVSSSRHHSPIYYLNTLYAKKLINKINNLSPDVIICPHIFSAQAITYLKLKRNLKIPAVGLMTDYTCSPFWEETRLEKYIIPAKELVGEFHQKGLPLEKLVPIGIPVNSLFKKKTPLCEARSVFGITETPVFVIMGGSMGYGRMDKLAVELHKRLPDAQIVAVCGNNRKLIEKLKCIKNVKPLGFIDNVDVLMDAADVLLTKPGGLSASEALTKRIPLVFTCPIPGGEEQNAKFLSSHHLCLSCNSTEKAAEAACELLLNPEKANRMVSNQNKMISRDIDKKIGDFIISLYGEEHLTQNLEG